VTFAMSGFRDLLAAVFNTPPDDVPPCVAQANSFREVVSLQALFVTLTVALVRFKSLAVITAGPGAIAFGSVVILTMMASMQFDPRLIWDNVEGSTQKPSGPRP
jgi:hypothetical protein